MNEKTEYLTREGLARLEAELEELITVGRRDVADRIAAAKELGDISESGEYEDAKNSKAFLEGRIREIQSILSRAQLIAENDTNNREVHLGSVVTLRFDGDDDEETWTLVGSAEAAPHEGRISNESPIGQALIGKRAGQKVVANTPSGVINVSIVKIE